MMMFNGDRSFDYGVLGAADAHVDDRARSPRSAARASKAAAAAAAAAAASSSNSELVSAVHDSIVGHMRQFMTPFGERPIVYGDWTASGRAVSFIEEFLQTQVMPMYGNTHTTTSITGLQTTCYRHEARQIVGQAVNAHRKDDIVLFLGAGSTAAINQMVHILGLDVALPAGAAKPVVFVGPYEHHSNLLPWRESCADVVAIQETARGEIDLEHLKEQLVAHADRPLRIGSFSAASNVTGILSNVDAVSELLHRHDALAFWDYATAAPYIPIDMNPVVEGPARPFVYKDAVFISTHKFVGGPGTPGVLVAKKRLFNNGSPTQPGGGTVFYVTGQDHRYLSNRVEREEGGTPDIVGSLRAGLAFNLKQMVGPATIERLEEKLTTQVLAALKEVPQIRVLGSQEPGVNRLPIISFLVRHDASASSGGKSSTRAPSRFLHHNFVSAVLNDLYGIQARGGCACAGPYAQDLMGISHANAKAIENALLDRRELLRPGFTRLSFPYFMSPAEVQYILSALKQLAEHAWRLLPLYRFNHKTGEWQHKTRFTKFPGRRWLSNLRFQPNEIKAAAGRRAKTAKKASKTKETVAMGHGFHYVANRAGDSLAKVTIAESELPKYLERAQAVYAGAAAQAAANPIPNQSDVLGEAAEPLRWFVFPSEVCDQLVAEHSGTADALAAAALSAAATACPPTMPIRPRVYGAEAATIEIEKSSETAADTAPASVPPPPNPPAATPLDFSAEAAAKLDDCPSCLTRRDDGDDSTVAKMGNDAAAIAAAIVRRIDDDNGNITGVDAAAAAAAAPPPDSVASISASASASAPPLDKKFPSRSAAMQQPATAMPQFSATLSKTLKQTNMFPKVSRKLLKTVGQAIAEWSMIKEGDRVLLGLSGGKDSLTLLHVLHTLQKRSPVRFELAAATVDPMTVAFDPRPLIGYMRDLGIPYFYLKEPIFDRAQAGELQGNSICAYCARMKRGLLYNCCRKEGYNVLALAQHLDDLAESFVMSAFNNGTLRTMAAHYTNKDGDVRIIRPLAYTREVETRKFSQHASLPVINENCPACFEAPQERHRVKKMLQQEETLLPQLYSNIRRAMLPLMDAPVCEYLKETTVARLKQRNKNRKQPSSKQKDMKVKAKSEAEHKKRKIAEVEFPAAPGLTDATLKKARTD